MRFASTDPALCAVKTTETVFCSHPVGGGISCVMMRSVLSVQATAVVTVEESLLVSLFGWPDWR